MPWWNFNRDDRHRDNEVVLNAINTLSAQNGNLAATMLNQMGNDSQGITDAIGQSTLKVTGEVCNLGHRVSDAAQNITQQIGQSTLNLSQQAGTEFRATNTNIGDTGRAILGQGFENTKHITQQISDAAQRSADRDAENTKFLANSASDGFSRAADRACENTKDITHEVTVGFKDALKKSCEDTEKLLLLSTCGFKDATARSYQAEANVVANIVAAKADLARQLAECCCELKEKINADGQETRALINAIEQRHCDRDLADAKAEILFLRGQAAHGGHHHRGTV